MHVLHMRRNGYLWTSGVNLDTAVRFADPDFLLECKTSAILRRFPLIFAFYNMMNVNHVLPVCLTYWPRKYTTRVDPYQVWSWHDHPLPSYSAFICWSATWHCDFDLWPFSRWSDVIHSESRDQPCHQVRRPYAHPCSIPICIFTVQLRWLYDESN